MSRVYITSNRFRKREGEMVPAVDTRPAEKFGVLVSIFDHAMDPCSDDDMSTAKTRLMDFDDEQDFILPSGSPLATLATGLLLRDNGIKMIQVLEWDRFSLKYHLKVVSL
jgi:hypothetical protein